MFFCKYMVWSITGPSCQGHCLPAIDNGKVCHCFQHTPLVKHYCYWQLIFTLWSLEHMVLTLQISIMGCMNIRLSYHFPWLVLTSKMRATNIFMQVILAQARFLSFPRLLTVLYCAHIYPYSDIFFLLCLNFQVHGNSFNHPKDFSNML